jgi:hypothetical protein
MSTFQIVVSELLEQGKISKRTKIELDSWNYTDPRIEFKDADEVVALATVKALEMDEFEIFDQLERYNSGVYDYTDWGNQADDDEWEDE